MPRIAAPRVRASAITRSICSNVTNGRTASCTSTISVVGSTCASAFATDCCRVSPPCTTRAGRPSPAFATVSCSETISSARVEIKNSVIAAARRQTSQRKKNQRHAIQFEELLRRLSAHAGAKSSSRHDSSNPAHQRANSLTQANPTGEKTLAWKSLQIVEIDAGRKLAEVAKAP